MVEDLSDDFWINGVGTDPLAVGNSSIEPCKYKGVAYAVIPMRTLNFYLVRAAAALVFTFYLTACGGGGGGGGGGESGSTPASAPPATNPASEPTRLAVLDSVPQRDIANVDPALSASSFAVLGPSDLSVELSSDCNGFTGNTTRRSLFDLSATDVDQLFDHNLRCDFNENTGYTVTASGARSNDAAFITEFTFSTGAASSASLTILDEFDLPRTDINDLFAAYIGDALFDDLALSSGVEALIRQLILELADASWSNLVDPEALYDVTSQKVSYRSRHPDGTPSAELTAAVMFPVIATASNFVTRDRVIILMHATGSTPSNLDNTDAWYILANLFASRGYLVITPDNYGRGGTDNMPETYLMAKRTGLNTLDLIGQVLDDTRYSEVYSGADIAIIGYSQGGHSAVGLHLLLETQGPDHWSVKEVYSGGAPHNLYQTVKGVMQHLDGSCDDGPYCRYVDEETTVPYATDRIFPGFLSYTDTGLLFEDVVTNEDINPAFVTAFLTDDPVTDHFKAMLQLSSFTQLLSAEDNFGASTAKVHLYHSEFDRLVPFDNTLELASLLETALIVDFHERRCNSAGYEAIFNVTEKVGVIHTLCGLSVLNEALADFK